MDYSDRLLELELSSIEGIEAFLPAWYLVGGGETIDITGEAVDEFWNEASTFEDQVVNAMIPTVAWTFRYAQLTGEYVGYYNSDWLINDLVFDPEDGFLHWLMHDTDVMVRGTYVADPCAMTLTITGTYTVYDVGDLHPWYPWYEFTPEEEKGYWKDTLMTAAEWYYNNYTLLGRISNAQPYNIYLRTTEQTTTFHFDPVNGNLESVTGFLGPWGIPISN